MKHLQFTSKKIENLIGLKSNTLHYYIKSGALVPEIDKGEGTGHTRLFSPKNFLEAHIIKSMINFGYSKNIILKVLKAIGKLKEWQKIKTKQDTRGYIIFYFCNNEIVCDFIKDKKQFSMVNRKEKWFLSIINLSMLARGDKLCRTLG